MQETITQNIIEVAKLAGEFIRKERASFSADKIEYKGLNDLVSYVDKTAEQMIVSGLSKILPEAGFITEEQTISRIEERYNWIIDPLDGTTNFIHGLPTFCVSIALKEYDELVAGVVYEVNHDECFYAAKDTPAYLNGKEIQVSKTPAIAQSLLATGFPYYNFEKQTEYIALFTHLMRNCHGLRRIGSAAVDLAYTACGRFDGYFEYNLKPWDIAAGIIIVRQAGGKVVDFNGNYNILDTCDVIAANSLIGNELLNEVRNYFR